MTVWRKEWFIWRLVSFSLRVAPKRTQTQHRQKAVQRNGKEEFLLQEKGDKKEQRNDNATTNRDAIHGKICQQEIQNGGQLGTWGGIKTTRENSDSSPMMNFEAWWLFGDSILYLNGRNWRFAAPYTTLSCINAMPFTILLSQNTLPI